jgi:hypothetical protein
MSRQIVISGTDPTNPKTAGEIADRLDGMRVAMARMYTEMRRLEIFAGSIRDVLHYEQSMPDKRAQMIACEVQSGIKALREEVEATHDQFRSVIDLVTCCGVNLRGRFEWRKP